MAKVSSYLYLASLAIADSLVLYIGLLRLWLGELTGTDFHDSTDWVCKLTISFGYMASDLSVWLIIAVTVERYIVVCFPLRASRLISTARAKRVVGLLVMLMLALNLHFFWTVEIVQRPVDGANVSNCQAAPLHERLVHDVWPWVDACIYSFVPFIVVLVLNILIIYEVVEAHRHRQHMQSSTPAHNYHHTLQPPATARGGAGRQTQVCSGTRQSRRSSGPGEGTKLTIMLLTVSFTFLLTTLPMNVSLLVTAFWRHNSSLRQTTQLKLAKTVAELLMYVNHSVNFFLYCATGHKFRQQIVLMLSCRTDPSYAPCTTLHTTEDSKVQAPPNRNGQQQQQHCLRTPQRHLLLAKADEDVGSVNGESIPLRAV